MRLCTSPYRSGEGEDVSLWSWPQPTGQADLRGPRVGWAVEFEVPRFPLLGPLAWHY